MNAEKPVFLEFSIRLSNGHFESTLKCPLTDSTEQKQKTVERWLQLIQTGLQIGATDMDVAFKGDSNDKA